MPEIDTVCKQAAERRHLLRIAVRPRTGDDEVHAALDQQMTEVTDDWRIESLWDGAETWLVTGRIDLEVGTTAYARQAHTLVQRLLDTGAFHHVEADIPVTAFDRPVTAFDEEDAQGAFGPDADLPGTEAKDWARRAIRCQRAWDVVRDSGGDPGADVLVGHPDTGYTLHPRLGRQAIDLDRDWDVITGDDDALDPLVPPDESPWAMPSPGHGTATGSVIAGRGTEQDGVVGVAPAAVLVPIRAVESVVQLFDSDVARAVHHARTTGCHIVSMSLGGKGFIGLREAIRQAVDSGMIVMAAAGNKVGIVVAPASYDHCIAVAATGIDDTPWPGTSRGRAVDISAPGWSVHAAMFEWDTHPPLETVRRSSGTSYAVAHLAGVAALWLGHHGVDPLKQRYGPSRVQAVFLHLLRQSSRRPSGWDAALGAGIVDAGELLSAALPRPEDVSDDIGAFGASDDPVDRLSALVNVEPDQLRAGLAARFGAGSDDLDQIVARFEGELAYLLLEDETFRASVFAGDDAGAFPLGPTSGPPAASPDLSAALVGR
jgi:hypothetical protein